MDSIVNKLSLDARSLLEALEAVGYDIDNLEHTDLDSGAIEGLATYPQQRAFALAMEDQIDNVVEAAALQLNNVEGLAGAYKQYCQAAVNWAHTVLAEIYR